MISIHAAVHDLKYTIDGYIYPASVAVDNIATETVLASGSIDGVVLYDPYSTIVVSVKDANRDHATYTLASVGASTSKHRIKYILRPA